jgi:hypothetical protein
LEVSPLVLRVQAEYRSFPLWVIRDGALSNVNPSQFLSTLPAKIIEDLMQWQRQFDATLDLADPASAGFTTPHDEELFRMAGRRIAAQLARHALGRFEVEYKPLGREIERME